MWQVRHFQYIDLDTKSVQSSHAFTDSHISKLSLTELTCLQSHYIPFVYICLVVEVEMFS